MVIIDAIIVVLVGLAIGSFLNVIILRMDELSTIIKDRSHCPKCKKILAWYDLIPFLSFIMLQAKCRYCKAKISWQYPIVELMTALVFLALFLNFAVSWALIFYAVLFSLLIVVLVYDVKTQTVPEVFVWIALAMALLGGWYFGEITFFSSLIGALIAGGFLGVLVYFSKEQWMGSGDVKIGIILGLIAGYPLVLVSLFSAFVFGSIGGILMILISHKSVDKQSLKMALPFAPFLILGILFSLLFGSAVINWYLNLFIVF